MYRRIESNLTSLFFNYKEYIIGWNRSKKHLTSLSLIHNGKDTMYSKLFKTFKRECSIMILESIEKKA